MVVAAVEEVKDHNALKPFFPYLSTWRIKKFFEHCFHHIQMPILGYLPSCHPSPNQTANYFHQSGIDCTDTIFGDVPVVDNGANAVQLWVGPSSKCTTVQVLRGLTKEDILLTLQDCI